MQQQIEDTSLKSARKRFIGSLILVALAIVYTIWPFDFLPDVFFPAGYLDDIPVLVSTALYAGYSYWKLRRDPGRKNA